MLAAEAQLIVNPYNELYPDIDNGKVVFTRVIGSSPSAPHRVLLFDLGTRQEKTIYSEGFTQGKLDGERVLLFPYNTKDIIYLLDLQTSNISIIKYGLERAYSPPDMDGNIITFNYRKDMTYNGSTDVYYYDLSTGNVTQVSNVSTTNEFNQRVYGGKIVFNDMSRNLFLYDVASKETTTLPVKGWLPVIYGNKVAYIEMITHGKWGIFLYDIQAGTETLVANIVDPNVYRIDMDANTLVWFDRPYGNYDIFSYELATRKVTQITNNTADQLYPSVSGDTIIWMDGRSGNWDIYSFNLTEKSAIYADSNPRGAAIYADYARKGTTPALISLTDGPRLIEIRKAGYVPYLAVVDIKPNQLVNIFANLTPTTVPSGTPSPTSQNPTPPLPTSRNPAIPTSTIAPRATSSIRPTITAAPSLMALPSIYVPWNDLPDDGPKGTPSPIASVSPPEIPNEINPPRKSSISNWLIAAALILFSIGAYYVYDKKKREEEENF